MQTIVATVFYNRRKASSSETQNTGCGQESQDIVKLYNRSSVDFAKIALLHALKLILQAIKLSIRYFTIVIEES